MITRQQVRDVMSRFDPIGMTHRVPGVARIPRVPALRSAGFHHEWSGDGHEKLNWKALGCGNCSLDIYLLREKFTGLILGLHTVPYCRDKWSVLSLYLDAARTQGGMPLKGVWL